jgi:chitooligosaccharide deacetylase
MLLPFLTKRIFALTFDDGPSVWTARLLDILAAHEARATFFVIGSVVESRADLVRRVVAEGHEVGNHSWSHPHLARDCDDEAVRQELERTNAVLEAVTGIPVRRFRAPYFDVDERVEEIAATLGLTHTHGTVKPPDWDPGMRSALISTAVLQLVRPQSIVALHDGIPAHEIEKASDTRDATLEAVATFLPRLRQQGYECVTASALLDA